MSSDTFYIELCSLEGDTAELLCTTSTAGGVNDYALTRSFALMALEDGMPYGADASPLRRGVADAGGQVWQESFHKEHVGKFIAKTELLARMGVVRDEAAWQEGRFEGGADAAEKFPSHKFLLRVQVTDPKYFEGLEVGSRWGTTAFDAWWDDPVRQSRAEMAEIERKATYWSPGKKSSAGAAKTSGAKKGAKKVAKKKTAAKKTAAKKAPAKKAAKKTAAKKAPAKKAAKKTAAKKAPAKKTAKKTAAKKTAKKAASKKTAKKKAAKKTAA